MTISEERIYYLLRAYTEQTATQEEDDELFQWVADTPDDAVLKDHIAQLIEAHAEAEFPEVNWEKIYRQVLEKAKEGALQTKIRRMRWFRVAAAVLVLLIAGGSFYWAMHQKQTLAKLASKDVSPYENDIKPGTTKATLQAGNIQVVLHKKDTSFTLAGNAVHINGGKVEIADSKPIQYTLTTPRGGDYKLVLSDGTKVWLNADSKIIYPSAFTGGRREVKLEGEAYFEVRTDAARPFIVKTGAQEIKVLGTEFNVNAYPGKTDIVTTLVSGEVQVSSAGKSMQLKPGQQVQLSEDGRLRLNPEADVEEAIAWKNGYFRFDKANIHTIMQQLARWYDIDVKYENGLQPHYFGAIISRDNNISGILNMLEATGEVQFSIKGHKVTVMPPSVSLRETSTSSGIREEKR